MGVANALSACRADESGCAIVHAALAGELVAANAIAPLSPVHLEAERSVDGSIDIGWIRRSRIDFGWKDGVDQTLAEDAERYSVAVIVDGETVRQWIVATNKIAIAASELVGPPFVGGAALTFEVRQIGRHKMSAPAIVLLILPF